MPPYNASAMSPLDQMRARMSANAFKTGFMKMAGENRQRAVNWLNHEKLQFFTLHLLMPEIESLQLGAELSPRNRTALAFCAELQRKADSNAQPMENSDEVHRVLRWIFLTGAQGNAQSNELDWVLDITASVLVHDYQDTDILPEIVHMIFRRHRKGLFIHDLVWVLFSSRDPHILRRIAEYYRSPQKADVELADRLLRTDSEAHPRRYSEYLSWYTENQPYLYFTNESAHQLSDPVHCRVDLNAKYLCHEISHRDKCPLHPLSENEMQYLNEFAQKPDEEKEILAHYSQRLHAKKEEQWRKWMENPLDRQIEIAKGGMGGRA